MQAFFEDFTCFFAPSYVAGPRGLAADVPSELASLWNMFSMLLRSSCFPEQLVKELANSQSCPLSYVQQNSCLMFLERSHHLRMMLTEHLLQTVSLEILKRKNKNRCESN